MCKFLNKFKNQLNCLANAGDSYLVTNEFSSLRGIDVAVCYGEVAGPY